ncbi:hypothetical protein CXB51_015614 [Gossypium anomalum]|uniref:Uncharacterized protein n=1 Tax=Gossypium anomalum TaxID=47600 RepID=A0A8J5YUG4_9ROSI|nr:hypothetical protein CXB51_015614 [Gossypium anomalum]
MATMALSSLSFAGKAMKFSPSALGINVSGCVSMRKTTKPMQLVEHSPETTVGTQLDYPLTQRPLLETLSWESSILNGRCYELWGAYSPSS